MRLLVRHVSAVQDPNVGLDYDRAGERYRAYADGDVDKLYEFDGQYAYGDQEIWRILGNTLNKLRARGRRELSVLDLGCGPGTWIRRIVDWAGKMGFTRITARGVDLAETQVRRFCHKISRVVLESLCDSRSAISGSRCRSQMAVSISACACMAFSTTFQPRTFRLYSVRSLALQRASSSPQFGRSAARLRSTWMA